MIKSKITSAILLASGLCAVSTVPQANDTPISPYDPQKAYTKGSQVAYKGKIYQAKWWTQNQQPSDQNISAWQVNEYDTSADPYAAYSLIEYGGSHTESLSNSPAGETLDMAFDGDLDTKYVTLKNSGEFVFTPTNLTALKGYSFTSANDEPNRDPYSWTIEGSNDGVNWQLLESQNQQEFTGRQQTREFNLNNNTQYLQYKFTIQNKGPDTYNYDILQFAELDLIGHTQKPIADFFVNQEPVLLNQAVSFSDTSWNDPNYYEWQFSHGSPATSLAKNPQTTFTSVGRKNISLTSYNWHGQSKTTSKEIFVIDPSDVWQGFEYPVLNIISDNSQSNPTAQAVVEQVFPDLESTVTEIILEVAKILYSNAGQPRPIGQLTIETGTFDFTAAKSGSDEHAILQFDLNHLQSVFNQSGAQGLQSELRGVLFHELTHVYSHVPDNGQYIPGTEYHTFLEALADYVRIRAGLMDHKREGISWVENWNDDAYNQTSFFLEWVELTYPNSDFIRRFNASADTIDNWTFDKAFKSIFGQNTGIETIFAEYQAHLISSGTAVDPKPTAPVGYSNLMQQSVIGISTNATHLGDAFDEGTNRLFDNSVYKKFNAVIERPFWLDASINVNPVSDVQIEVEFNQAYTVGKYSFSTAQDNMARFPTAWTVSGSNDGVTWVALSRETFNVLPEKTTTYEFDLPQTNSAYSHYKFTLENTRTDGGIGGDNGRLIQLGELAVWSQN